MNDNVDLYQSLKEKYNIRVIALSMDKIEDVKSYIYDRSDWIDIFEFYFIEAD